MRVSVLALAATSMSGCMSSPGDQLASIETMPVQHRNTTVTDKTSRLAQQQEQQTDRSDIASQAARDADYLNAQIARNPNTLNAQAAAIEAYAAKKRQQLAEQNADPALANSLAARKNIAATQTSIYSNPDTSTVMTVAEPQQTADATTQMQPADTGMNASRNSIYSGASDNEQASRESVPLPDADTVGEVQELALAGKTVLSEMEVASADPSSADLSAAQSTQSDDSPTAAMPAYDKAVADVAKEEQTQPKQKRLTLMDFFRKKTDRQTASFDGDRFGNKRRTDTQSIPNMRTASADNDLPGVNAMMPVRALGADESGEDVEDDQPAGLMKLASLPGMMRVAPNGLWTQTDKVDISCLRPQLVNMLQQVQQHYQRPVVVTSGYRNPGHNRVVGGARHSLHTLCAAADIQVQGVTKWELADYLRSIPGRGGVGTYCHTESVHIDIGGERDWNWRCRRRRAF